MTATWNTSVWTQERNILTLSGFGTGMVYAQIVTTSPSGYSAKYVIPTNGTLKIDLSDLVRLAATGGFTVTEYDSNGTAGTSLSRTWTKTGLINPSNVLIPKNDIAPSFLLISPPSVMLRQIGTTAATAIVFSMRATPSGGYYLSTCRIKSIPSGTFVNASFSENTLVAGSTAFELWHLNDAAYQHTDLQELFDCKQYACVEWVSFTGTIRRHTFEVINQKTETLDTVSLQTIDNQYDERKGRRDGFTLRLEGLNRYDFWYYADLITSSQVRVTFDGTHWAQVQVTSKEVEIPNNDEGAFNTLEIEVNYKKYDTI